MSEKMFELEEQRYPCCVLDIAISERPGGSSGTNLSRLTRAGLADKRGGGGGCAFLDLSRGQSIG